MTVQEQILRDTAEYHGITITQARDILDCASKYALSVISEGSKVDGLLDHETFKSIHIKNFGTFIPNKYGIKAANKVLKKLIK
jgi:hypothetical protein